MEHRIPLIGAVITCALLATGLVWTDESEGAEPVPTVTTTSATTSVSTTSTTAAAAPTTTTTAVYPATVETIADQSRRAFSISGAGSVVIGRLAGSLWVF
ncbi:MAG: hypothetical protein M3488_07885, partial [Actinomycetota bacterium]|nr:hypothetical protein [Actinomycetota bacterium]